MPIASIGPLIRTRIKKNLTINNPAFVDAIRLELAIRVNPVLRYFRETDDYIEAPIGSTPQILSILGSDWGIDDQRNESKLDIDYKTDFVLRDYQIESLEALKNRTVGVIEAPTGTGKTYIILELIKQKQQNTIILVDTYELAEQFKKRLKELTNVEEIGFVGGGKKEWKPITIALLQTMRNLTRDELKYVNENFGMILCDEVHIVAANTYYNTLRRLNIKYKFGFSATPERADGLTPVIFWATGPKVHVVTPRQTQNHIIQPTLEIVKTTFTWPLIQNTDYSYMVSDLSIDAERNRLIVNHYNTNETHKNMQAVFLCTLRTQIYILWDMLGRTGGVLISPLDRDSKFKLRREAGASNEDLELFNSFSTKKNRDNVIKNLRSGKIDKVFSTYALFNKGIDIDTLELMYMCGPTRSKTRVLQSKGRIVRKRLDGQLKQPKIVHVFDERIDMLKWQGYSVHRILRQSIQI